MDENFFSEYIPYLLLAAGLILTAVSLLYDADRSHLKKTGITAEGIVFDQEYKSRWRSGSDLYNEPYDKIIIRFQTKEEQWITGEMKQSFGLFYTGQYKQGERVLLYYDKDDPSKFYVATKQSEFVVRCIGALIGILFTALGVYRIFFQEG